jgi:hypothetical protein
MCDADRPQKLPLTLHVTVPSHAKYSHDPLLLDNQKHLLTLGFLKDMLEAKCAVPDAKQLLFYRDNLLDGEPNERLVDILPADCNVTDVIVLTLHHADHFAASGSGGGSSSASKAPPSAPLLRKKSSRSRTAAARPSPSPAPPGSKDADGFDDDEQAFAADDDDADWGDDGDAGWGNSDDEVDASGAAPAAEASAAAAAAVSAPTPAAAASAPSSSSGFVSSLSLGSGGGESSSAYPTYESHFARTAHYILRKPSQMEAHVRALLEDMSEVLGLTVDEVGILCRNFKERWNRVRIEEQWMEDSDKLREQVGLGPESAADASTAAAGASSAGKLVECQTCGDDEVPLAQSFALSCGHVFCLSCWTSWILAEFDKGPVCINTKCQGFKCRVVVPTAFQMKCLPVSKREKLTAWLLEDFVSSHSRNYKGCPHSDCLMTAQRVEGVEHVGGVECACAHSWSDRQHQRTLLDCLRPMMLFVLSRFC